MNRKEILSGRTTVYVDETHRFGTDAFLLCDFAAPRRRDLVADLGAGCGIIALLCIDHFDVREVHGVEIQPQAQALFARAIEENHLAGRVVAHLADLRDLPPQMPKGRFDVVISNPPYKESGRGIVSEQEGERIARHETLCSLDDVCAAASSLLKFGGRFCLCQRPERLCDIVVSMRRWNIEPKRMRFVQKYAETAPWLVLFEGIRGGKPFLKADPPLIVYQKDGRFTDEVVKIYQKGSKDG